jgi:hypothetical protein
VFNKGVRLKAQGAWEIIIRERGKKKELIIRIAIC